MIGRVAIEHSGSRRNMGTPSFELKLDRAIEHLHTLDAEANAWINTETCKIVNEPDPEPPLQSLGDGYAAMRVRLCDFKGVPQRLSVHVGDCLFNLRSSLDHLALALARHHTITMTDRQIADSEFPIFANARSFQRDEQKKIGCIAPVARTAINALQPYHCGNNPGSHPLWQLHQLNRIDKHRQLTICQGWVAAGTHLAINAVNVRDRAYTVFQRSHFDFTAPKIDTVFVRWAGFPHNPAREMRMEFKLPLVPTFQDGASGLNFRPVVPAIQAICDFVRDSVISPLSKFL
jgi:hypothetical protein